MSASLFSRIHRRLFLDPAGYGRPLSREVLDGEYRSGAWSHFDALAERPRQLLVAGLAACLHPRPLVLDVGYGSGLLPALSPDGHFLVSHYRSWHWDALWRRIEAVAPVQSATMLSNRQGQTWDIKILQPRPGTARKKPGSP
jgi:hypothetical protein